MKIDKNEFRKYAVRHRHVQSLLVDDYISKTESRFTASMTPYITEERELRVAQMDVFSRLMMDRIIFLGAAVDDNVANIIQAQLLFLQSTDPKKDIQMYINSPGGSVYAGFGIYDTMHLIAPDVATICTGMAASMAAALATPIMMGLAPSWSLPVAAVDARRQLPEPQARPRGDARIGITTTIPTGKGLTPFCPPSTSTRYFVGFSSAPFSRIDNGLA